MTAVIKQTVRSAAALSVVQQIESNQARYSYFVGKADTFRDSAGNAITYEDPTNTPGYEGLVRSNMVMVKNISAGDISLVVPRIDWISGTIFNKWDANAPDTTRNYYCFVESSGNVYKCLNSPGTGSTVQPSGTNQIPVSTTDGYTWKYLYTLPSTLKQKFLTSTWLPVTKSLSVRNFSSGSIEKFRINSAGSGINASTISAVVSGDGSGAAVTPIISGGKLVNLQITNAGTGYTYAQINFTGTATTLPIVDVIISYGDQFSAQSLVERFATPGTIDSVTVVSGGTGFSGTPVPVITGDGSGATATVTLSGSSISKINITNPGTGYSWAKISFTGNSTFSGYCNISPPLGHGRDVVNELGADSVMFYTTLGNNQIGGSNINTSFRQFGIIKDIREYGTYDSQYADVVSTNTVAVAGTYTSGSSITDFSVGTSVSWNSGASTGTVMATITGTDASFIIKIISGTSPVAGTLISANAKSFTVASSTLQSIFQGTFGSTCYTVFGSYTFSAFSVGDTLTTGSNKFMIVSKDSDTGSMILLPLNTGTVVTTGNVLSKQGGSSFTVTNVNVPTVDKRTGDILFIDNRQAFNQSAEQVVSFRTVIKF